MVLLGSALGPFLALGVVVLFFVAADAIQGGNTFLSGPNLRALAKQIAPIAVAALGMTIIIIAGGIDLSAGTAIALCATVLAWSLKEDVAMLMLRGENVAGATQELRDGNEDLSKVRRKITRLQADAAPNQTDRKALQEQQALQRQLEAEIPVLKQRLEQITADSRRITRFTPWIAVVLAVLTGCLCGFLNGAVISFLNVVPFIVTLGTMTFFLGLAKIIAHESTVRPNRAEQIPQWLINFLSIRQNALIYGFPAGVWLALVLSLLLAAVLRYAVFSRYLFALGSNESTARLCGINVTWNKIAVYTLAGLFVGVAGIYQFSLLSAGNPTSGIGMELKIIAAVVIGGGSLNGGRGSVLGTITGTAIMAVIASGCTLLGLSNPIQEIIIGVIIVVAVTVDQMRRARLAD